MQAEADSFGPEGPTSFDPVKLAYTSRVLKELLRARGGVWAKVHKTN